MATYYPPVGFSFQVIFEGLGASSETGFQEVSGLNLSIETETYQEGGENRFSYRFPKPLSFGNITIKRGMLVGSALIDWFDKAASGFKFQPVTVHINLLDQEQQTLESWVLTGAYPVKWNIDAFNAQDGKVVAETIELCYQYFVRQGASPKESKQPEQALPVTPR